MRVLRNVLVFAGALSFLSVLPLAAEDLTVVFKVTSSRGGGTPQTETHYMSSDKFRTMGGDHDVLMEFATDRIVMIDNKKKEYWETTAAEMNAMASAAADQMKQAQEQMKQIPPEQLKMLPPAVREQMMGKAGGAEPPVSVTVQKGTTSRKIAGYDCDNYTITMGDSYKMELCNTTAVQPPAGLYEAMKAQFAGNPMAGRMSKVFEELKKLKGFGLAETTTMSMMGQTFQTSREATEVKKGAIAASAFAIPAGYKKTESPMKGAAEKMQAPRKH